MRRADADPKSAVTFRLHATREYLAAGDPETATLIIESTPVAPDSINAYYAQLLFARLALGKSLPDEALARSASPPRGLPRPLSILRHEVRAEAHEMRRDAAAAVDERLKLARLIEDPAARDANTLKLWKAIVTMPAPDLERLRRNEDAQVRGWSDLALMAQNPPRDAAAFERAIESWRANYPDHAAVPLITDRLLAGGLQSLPRQVALLLPFRGQYGDVAEAIRDGFVAAWLRRGAPASSLRIYDADALNIVDQYRQAVADGAEFVLGPLEKSALENLLKDGPPPVPTLALNRLDESGAVPPPAEGFDEPHLLQFGLTPENEARQVARRAHADGHRRALVLAPRNDWGERMQRAFRAEWEALGGIVAEHGDYSGGQIDFSDNIVRLMNLDSSHARAAQLRNRLGRNVHGGGRLRADADMVFVAANPVGARQIMPQFRFYGVNRMAVYATSHVYGGSENPAADADLDGLLFGDMPWVLGAGGTADDLAATLDRHWSTGTSPLRRFYALGIDACLLIPQIRRLTLDPDAAFDGVTGRLRLLPDDTVERELAWARFAGGRPQPVVDTP